MSRGVGLYAIYTPRAKGPRLCKCVETKPSDITDLYQGANQIHAALDTLSNQH